MKKSTNEMTMKEAIAALIEAYRMGDKISETRIKDTWDRLMGPYIAARTTQIMFKEKILYVTLDSPVLRQELMMNKSMLIANLNEALADTLINDIHIK